MDKTVGEIASELSPAMKAMIADMEVCPGWTTNDATAAALVRRGLAERVALMRYKLTEAGVVVKGVLKMRDKSANNRPAGGDDE